MVWLDGRQIWANEDLAGLYESRLAERGISAELMFYQSEDQHIRKLIAISAVLTQTVAPGDDILDVGCGFGRLLDWFKPLSAYRGVDLVESFIAEARRRHPRHFFDRADFLAETPPKPAAWIVLAGVLNSIPEPYRVLERSLTLARCGVVFDVLIQDRLPLSFKELNWFDLEAVKSMVADAGFRPDVYDGGQRYIVLRAIRG